MKNINSILFGLTLLIFNSCQVKKSENQIYPEFTYEKIEEITLTEYNTELNTILNDDSIIELFSKYFNNSNNYFRNDLIERIGVKPKYFIKFKTEKENLELTIYPTLNKNKVEIGFFRTLKLNENKNVYRKYNRFYINSKILNLIESEMK